MNETEENPHLEIGSSENGETSNDDEVQYSLSEHTTFCKATTAALEELCNDEPFLSDLPYDCSPEELQAQIALAKGQAVTVYVERDGLSTLKVVIPKPSPTVADLKRSIRATVESSRKRQLRKAKHKTAVAAPNRDPSESPPSAAPSSPGTDNDDRRRKSSGGCTTSSVGAHSSTGNGGSSVVAAVRSSCKHPHRRAVSWKFIWRTYVLCDVVTNQPLIDGRKFLSELGVASKSLLKFVKREHIFGRKRRR